MSEYEHSEIESKWQKTWEKAHMYEVDETSDATKTYLLVEFPFPSGDGLHVGHVRSYTALDILARKRRMQGENVLYPMGWDAFGLPTENFAIKTGIHPSEVTKNNTDNFRTQLKMLGLSFDWSREINTTDPSYYKWTQWIFLQMYKDGLAYKEEKAINWCLSCKIGLANEEVIDGACERCGGETEKRNKEQWMLAITKYAERLDKDLDEVDYLDRVKLGQRNWIGRSEGAEIDFKISGKDETIKVFTTRPDTLFGATYMVLAPEHPLVEKLKSDITNITEVQDYIQKSAKKTDIERTAEGKEKTGIILEGINAINPANQKEIPVFIADYVLSHYGTGAIMAVPAHDERDYEFAQKFNLESIPVISQPSGVSVSGMVQEINKQGGTTAAIDRKVKAIEAGEVVFTGIGLLQNSGNFNGLRSEDAKGAITEYVGGVPTTSFKLNDWVFSRQRYWGEPIPMIACPKDGWVPVPEEQLPVTLPAVEKYEPSDDGESPLAAIEEWVNTTCPTCGGKAKRETDTMPNWAGSSWYYLRYIDPKNDTAIASPTLLQQWTPVTWYNGGMEHTTLHLLYSRFWHKYLFDKGIVPTSEPYAKRTSHGLILAQGGEKMSKSKGNVINPNDVVKNVGADTLRVYEMFMGPFDQAIPWNTDNMVGSRRFLERVWRLQEIVTDESDAEEVDTLLHKTVKKVTDDIEAMKFNTAVSACMVLVNQIEETGRISKEGYKTFLQIVAPFAPHMAEELWEMMGEKESIHKSSWPTFDPEKLVSKSVTVVIQVNGKVRDKIEVEYGVSEAKILELAMKSERVQAHTQGKEPKKVIYIENKLLNIVA